MQLSHKQKKHFYDHGFLVVPDVLPGVMVDRALRAINQSLGRGIDPALLPVFQAQSFCPELKQDEAITDLINRTPALPYIQSLLGEEGTRPVRGGQLAIRFPNSWDPPQMNGPHLDGMSSKNNGVPENTIKNFTLLAGVLLSDLTTEWAGNFTIWPGTHHKYEAYFREHGPEALLNGMPKIDMPEPLQVRGKAGSLVLVHYQLAHTVAPNVSPHIRYACFYRFSHPGVADDWKAPMKDIWMHYPGMKEIAYK